MANKQRILRVLKQSDLDDIVAIDEAASKQSRREYYERKIASILNRKTNINCSIVCEEDGKVVGNQLWFTTRHQLPSSGQPLLTTFSGELSDEGVLHLTMLAEGSESRLTLTPSPI